MSALVDRFYGTTIPEHGPSPAPMHPLMPRVSRGPRRITGTMTVTLALQIRMDYRRGVAVLSLGDRVVDTVPIPLALIARKQTALHTDVMRRCAGIRRRQQRRSK